MAYALLLRIELHMPSLISAATIVITAQAAFGSGANSGISTISIASINIPRSLCARQVRTGSNPETRTVISARQRI